MLVFPQELNLDQNNLQIRYLHQILGETDVFEMNFMTKSGKPLVVANDVR